MHLRATSLALSVIVAVPLSIPAVAWSSPVVDQGVVETTTTSVELSSVDAGGAALEDALPTGAPEKPLAAATTDAVEPDALPEVISDPEELVALSPEVELDPRRVQVIGASWPVDAAGDGVQVDVRTYRDGGWTEWEALEIAPSGDAGERSTRSGTDPHIVTGAERAQVRVANSDGAQVPGARLDVIDPGRTTEDGHVATAQPGSADAAAASPTIYSRSYWGASSPTNSPSFGVVRGAVVHHTAGSNGYTSGDVPGILRGIQSYHMRTLGWNDIGYNMLVDKFGRVWEGRAGGVDKAVIGAQASGYNAETFGIAVMGDYTKVAVPSAVVTSLSKTLAWKLDLHGVRASSSMTANGTSLPSVVGHMDVGTTACPGAIQGFLPTIRTEAQKLQDASITSSTPTPAPTPTAKAKPFSEMHDWSGDSSPDVLAADGSGRLHLYRGNGKGGFGGKRSYGTGWLNRDLVNMVGDWNGDGHNDVIAREKSTGNLWLYRGDGKGGFVDGRSFSTQWQGMSHLVAPGDWDGDGKPDLISIERSSQRMWLYPGDGTGGFQPRVAIGSGWGVMDSVIAVGDWSGDGAPDLVARDSRNGNLLLYAGNGRGGWAKTGQRIGTRWDVFTSLVGAGDWNGDGRADILGRTPNGNLYLYRGNGAGGFSSPFPQIGHGWQGFVWLS